MRTFAATMLVLATSVVAVSACEREDILLLSIPDAAPTPEDAALEASTEPCEDDRQCGPSAFCQKRSCGERNGTCEGRPSFCDEAPAPVCGCDGVTYWNDCLRRSRGQRASSPGECHGPKVAACGDRGSKPCPGGASCAKLAPVGACSPDVPGACWVVPAVCPSSSGVDRFVKCGPPDPACVDLCAAVRSGFPHARAEACP